jgi:quinone-modifying oxidoreductase, subunit QmoC
MSAWNLKREIKYEEELDHDFYKEIGSLAWGEKLLTCIQCGTCSGTCPLSLYMDHTPRQIIAMTRAGFKDDVFKSNTHWLCASCYSCTVECPKEIKITDVMYALKQQAIKEHKYPKRFPVPVLAREFYNMVKHHGRQSEGPLIIRLYLNTNPFAAISLAFMGLHLFFQQRIGLKTESIPMGTGKKGDLKKILDACDNIPVK